MLSEFTIYSSALQTVHEAHCNVVSAEARLEHNLVTGRRTVAGRSPLVGSDGSAGGLLQDVI